MPGESRVRVRTNSRTYKRYACSSSLQSDMRTRSETVVGANQCMPGDEPVNLNMHGRQIQQFRHDRGSGNSGTTRRVRSSSAEGDLCDVKRPLHRLPVDSSNSRTACRIRKCDIGCSLPVTQTAKARYARSCTGQGKCQRRPHTVERWGVGSAVDPQLGQELVTLNTAKCEDDSGASRYTCMTAPCMTIRIRDESTDATRTHTDAPFIGGQGGDDAQQEKSFTKNLIDVRINPNSYPVVTPTPSKTPPRQRKVSWEGIARTATPFRNC